MKSLLIVLLLAFGAFAANAQITTMGGKKTTVENLGGFVTDSTFRLPKKYASSFTNLDSQARMWFDPGTLSIWFHDGSIRQRLASTTYVSDVVNNAFAGLVKFYNYKLSNVNAAIQGNNNIATTLPDHGRFIITSIVYVYTEFTGTITTPPTISFGFTPTAYTDNLGPLVLPSSPVVNIYNQNSLSNKISVPASTAIVARISTAATFTTVGTYILDIYVQGFYETQ